MSCYFSTILMKSNRQGSFVRALPAPKFYQSMISKLKFPGTGWKHRKSEEEAM